MSTVNKDTKTITIPIDNINICHIHLNTEINIPQEIEKYKKSERKKNFHLYFK